MAADKSQAGPSPSECEVLRAVAADIADPSLGLPDPVFHFVLRLVPMINVDLFVVSPQGRVLLAWREDEYADGWHVPGGIVRGGEPLDLRLDRTAREELGGSVRAGDVPAAILQLFGDRGHFLSLVYRCELQSGLSHRVIDSEREPEAGDLCWFSSLPSSLYPTHEIYRPIWDDLVAAREPSVPIVRTLRLSERSLGTRGWTL